MKFSFVLILLFIPSVVSAFSMADLLPHCNHNTRCEQSETNEYCPEDCPLPEEVHEVSVPEESHIPLKEHIRGNSQIIATKEEPFPFQTVFSLVFVVVFLTLLILLFSWIHNKKISLIQKKNSIHKPLLEKSKNGLYSKPERKL